MRSANFDFIISLCLNNKYGLVQSQCPRSSITWRPFCMFMLGFEFYEVKKNCYYFSKRKWKYFYTFNHFYSEKSSERAKQHKFTTLNLNLPDIKSFGKAEVFFIRVANSVFLENPQKFLQKSQICRTPLTGGVAKRSAKIRNNTYLMPGPCSGKNLISILVTDYIQKRRGQALFSFEYNLLPNLIHIKVKVTDRA